MIGAETLMGEIDKRYSWLNENFGRVLKRKCVIETASARDFIEKT